MVNEVVLNYLKSNKGKYSMESLKSRIVTSGYSEADFDEALKALNSPVAPTPQKVVASPISSPQTTPSPSVAASPTSATPSATQPTEALAKPEEQISQTPSAPVEAVVPARVSKSSGIKWMLIAGIIGFVLLALNLIFTILDVLNVDVFSSGDFPDLKIIIFGVFVIILLGFYFFGFERLGKKIDSELLRFSSIVIPILFLLFASSYFWMGDVFGDVADLFGEGVFLSSEGNFSLLPVLFGLLILFIFFSRYIFVLALIKKGYKVEFAKMAGVVGLIVVIISTLFFAYTVYLSLNPTALEKFISSNILDNVVIWAGLAFEVLIFISLLVESIVLIYGSKNFE